MVLFPTANCRSILTSNTLCSTNLRTPSPQSPPRSSVQKEGKIETKQLGEAWPKKTGRQIMMKGGHHEEGMHSVNNILLHGHRPSKHFLGYSYSGSSMYHHFWRNTLQLAYVSGICTLVGKHSCHRYMPFCQWRLFANSLALQVPRKYLLYLLCARLSKKSVNMCSYPGIFPKPVQLNKSRKYHQEILF